jgi:hypothetical protein
MAQDLVKRSADLHGLRNSVNFVGAIGFPE